MRGRKTGTDADGIRRTSIRLRFRERPERVPHFERTSSAGRRPLFAGRWPLAIIHCPLAAAAGGSQRLGDKPDQIRQRLGTDSTTIRQQLCRTSASIRQRVGRAAADAEPRRRQVLHPALQTTRTVFQFIDRGDAGLDRRDNIGLLVVGYDTLAAVVLQTLLRTYPANRE